MREILFRGKTAKQNNGVTTEKPIKENMWVYGNLTVGKLENYHIDMISNKKEIYTIKSETIGQFTGSTDKNGKKIFDGDIVKYVFGYENGKENREILLAVWDKEYCRFMLEEQRTKERIDLLEFETTEVIGNKWDNLELLEGSNEKQKK